jgi:phosphoglycerol transferase MdoB-like AlkP superfamily enzyme
VAVLASRYPAFDVPAERHAAVMSSSLAAILAGAGYRTALFHSGRFMYLGMEQVLAQAGFGDLEDAGAIGGNAHSSFGIDEPATVHRILQWIDAAPRNRRFLAVYLPIAGHHPYNYSGAGVFPPTTEVNRYRNALHEGDEAFGALIDGIRQRGLADSTLIVVIGDHGEAFGQHPGNIGHDLALYEENVHVPLVIHVPGMSGAVRHAPQVASLLDISPTVLDLLGQSAPTAFQGESLLSGKQRVALFFTDYSLGLLGLRDGCTKDIYEMESGRSRMYNVCEDADERNDLAVRMAERAGDYRDRLRRWSADQVARVTPSRR